MPTRGHFNIAIQVCAEYAPDALPRLVAARDAQEKRLDYGPVAAANARVSAARKAAKDYWRAHPLAFPGSREFDERNRLDEEAEQATRDAQLALAEYQAAKANAAR